MHEETVRSGNKKKKKKRISSTSSSSSSKKKYGYDASDDFICDDDSDESSSLNNILVLHGPPSSGKSTMVHAAALAINAKLIEVNTTVDRSNSTLRKLIEEATKSHSLHLVPIESDSDDDEDLSEKVSERSERASFGRRLEPFVLFRVLDHP